MFNAILHATALSIQAGDFKTLRLPTRPERRDMAISYIKPATRRHASGELEHFPLIMIIILT